MKKVRKEPKVRISVALPPEMLHHFRLLSEDTGLSISRLIYLRLRSRNPILIVRNEMLQEIKFLREMLADILKGAKVSDEKFCILEAKVRQISDMVDFDSPTVVVHVKRR